jgi:hypothetical protein
MVHATLGIRAPSRAEHGLHLVRHRRVRDFDSRAPICQSSVRLIVSERGDICLRQDKQEGRRGRAPCAAASIVDRCRMSGSPRFRQRPLTSHIRIAFPVSHAILRSSAVSVCPEPAASAEPMTAIHEIAAQIVRFRGATSRRPSLPKGNQGVERRPANGR